MGTKNNPGNYDCYAKLDPDEPYFVLRAKDPSATYLVRIWEKLRSGDLGGAMYTLAMAMKCVYVRERVSTEGYAKLDEANRVSREMEDWYQNKVRSDDNVNVAIGITPSRLGDDAAKWAEAFCRTFPDCGVDKGTMIGWFANAIEISHDLRVAQQQESSI